MKRKENPKFFAKKRTRSGRYITIAEGETRKELIENIKSDSETDKQERGKDGKETHRHTPV